MKSLLAFVLFAAYAVAADQVVFEGTPSVRFDANGTEVKKSEISSRARCVIAKRGRSYLWASRQNRKLDRLEAGDFTYYISPEGSGYIKVLTRRSGNETYDYMEHLSTGFTTVTYWGKASEASRIGSR